MIEEGLLVLSKACVACDIPRCGTWGCILPDRHNSLHQFALTGKRKRNCGIVITNNHAGVTKNTENAENAKNAKNADNAIEAAAEGLKQLKQLKQLKHMRQSPNSAGHPLQQVIIRIDSDGSVIVPKTVIPSLRIKCKWSGAGRATWYTGTITHISEDEQQVFVVYDDGDKYWEEMKTIKFL